MPELDRICPELHAELSAEHARTNGLQREIEALLSRLEAAGETERVSLGARLHDRVPRLVAEHLRHMAHEETEAERALQANRTDAELRALHDRIIGRIPPARMPELLALILPAATLSERRHARVAPAAGRGRALGIPWRFPLGTQLWKEFSSREAHAPRGALGRGDRRSPARPAPPRSGVARGRARRPRLRAAVVASDAASGSERVRVMAPISLVRSRRCGPRVGELGPPLSPEQPEQLPQDLPGNVPSPRRTPARVPAGPPPGKAQVPKTFFRNCVAACHDSLSAWTSYFSPGTPALSASGLVKACIAFG